MQSVKSAFAAKGVLLVLLFALPFAAVGTWAGYSIARNVYDAWRMQGWSSTNGTLVDAGYTSNTGDDSTTYKAYATYRYNVNGQSYTGSRVGLSGGSDNVGDWQMDTGARLAAALERNEPVPVYYDPAAPAEAILDRELRIGMLGFKAIFFLLFGGVGYGLMFLGISNARAPDVDMPLAGGEAWQANPDWLADGIRSGSRAAMYGSWFFAVFWNLVSAPLPFLLYDEVVNKENYPALLGLLFPVVGAGLLVWAIRRTLEWRRFGAAPVILDPFPGSIGGQVGGYIDLRIPYDSAHRFDVTLACLESYISGSGKNRSRRERAEWQDEQVTRPVHGPLGTRIQFRFDVPDGHPPADARRDNDRYCIWRLGVSAELPGTDFNRDYEIPVYATGQQSEKLTGRDFEAAETVRQSDVEKRVRERLGLAAFGGRLYQGAGRHLGGGLTGFFIGTLFAGIGAYLFSAAGERLFGIVFGGVGALVALLCLYLLLNTLTVTLEGNELRSVRRLLGIPVSDKRLSRYDLRTLEPAQVMSSQSGGRHTVHYRIEARDSTGRSLTVATGLRGLSEARAAMRILEQDFDLNLERPAAPEADSIDILAAD